MRPPAFRFESTDRGRDRPVRVRLANVNRIAKPSKVVMAAKRPDFRREWAVKDSNLRPWD